MAVLEAAPTAMGVLRHTAQTPEQRAQGVKLSTLETRLFDLQPIPTATAHVDTAQPLRHDPFQAQLVRVPESKRVVALECLAELDPVKSGDKRLQQCAENLARELARVLASKGRRSYASRTEPRRNWLSAAKSLWPPAYGGRRTIGCKFGYPTAAWSRCGGQRGAILFRQLLKRHARHFAVPGAEDARETVARKTSVFILSSPQSGSTWVGYVLGSGPESAFVGEYSRAWDETARVPCTLCAARGLRACEVLYDIEMEPADKAFDLAFARAGKRVIVDSSKDLGWTQRFQNSANMEMRIVHLVRDPRGFFASVKRRGWTDLSAALALWSKQNREFRDFNTSSRIPSVVVGYDVLANAPKAEFQRLYAFCGMRFTGNCLSYWTVEHHGFAANGASDAIVKAAIFQMYQGS